MVEDIYKDKKLLTILARNILLSSSILFTILYLKPGDLLLTTFLVVVIVILYDLLLYIGWDQFKKYLFLGVIVYLLGLIIRNATLRYGVLGVVVVVLLFSAYRIYKGRSFFMESMRNIETRIFGKPLDKNNFEDDKE